MSIQTAELREALLTLDRVRAQQLLQAAAASMAPLEVVETLVRPALEQVGDLWDHGDCALSQVYMSGRICEELLDQLLTDRSRTGAGEPVPAAGAPRLAIAVLEDFHLLGKQIVRTMMRSSGHPVLDYGRQTVDGLVERVCTEEVDILLVSTLMLPAALRVEPLMRRLSEAAPSTRVVVGGAPYRFDAQLWRDVGAHAVGLNAGEVVGIVERLQRGEL